MPYVNARWLGGMLTNFQTISKRVKRMEELEAMEADGQMALRPKKEQILLRKELSKLQTNLNGIRNMKRTPDAVFVIDTSRDDKAVNEARKLGISVVGTLDTNCDPDLVDYGIPANDDAIRSVRLLTEFIADAVIAGTGTALSAAEMQAGSGEAAQVEAASVSVAPKAEAPAEKPAKVAEKPATKASAKPAKAAAKPAAKKAEAADKAEKPAKAEKAAAEKNEKKPAKEEK